MMRFFGSLSRWNKALLLSCLLHLALASFFLWPTESPDGELQVVDMSDHSSLEMDVAPPDTDAVEETLAPEEQTPPAPALPTPPAEPKQVPPPTSISMEKPLPPPKIKEPSNVRRIITPPILIKTVNPRYPEKKLQELPSFKLTFIVNISESGQPNFVAVQKSSGIKELDQAAEIAVRQWLYTPAFDNTLNRFVSFSTVIDLEYPAPNSPPSAAP